MKLVEANKLKVFQKEVRWNFKIAIHGYGKDVKKALIDAAGRLENEAISDYGTSDYVAIQNHEVVSIDEDDVADE